jgi:hypothetical protein
VTPDGASVVNMVMLVYFSCQPGGSFTELIRASFTVPVLPDGSFDASGSGQGLTAEVNGRLVAEGVASGTLQIHLSYDEQGSHYECDTGNGTWGAAWRVETASLTASERPPRDGRAVRSRIVAGACAPGDSVASSAWSRSTT